MNCPLCNRPLGTVNINEHHLMPKTFGGKVKEPLHEICHRKIHSVFTERELKNYYHTWERLLESDELQKFIAWVSKKDPGFYDGSTSTNVRKSKGRR
jgi:5-methylcytosine-specific restriction endonuclease McrA